MKDRLFRRLIVDGRHVHRLAGGTCAVMVAHAGQITRQGTDDMRVPGLPLSVIRRQSGIMVEPAADLAV